MRHRDWGSGEGRPRERQPIAPWGEPAEPLPVDAYAAEGYRTPSRRRALERGQQEPVDTYLPRWAVESGVRRADGGGRHAAPDDDDAEPPHSGGGWRADVGGRREGDRRELPAIGAGPAGGHTAEWVLDNPQEPGYVGSRRAESLEDAPVSGPAARRRPRRTQSSRPQVIWSALPDAGSPGEEGERWEETRAAGRRTVTGSWSAAASASRARPAEQSERSGEVEPWDRGRGRQIEPWDRGRAVEPDPGVPPAVDPWDASGVHAWDRSGVGWDRAEGADRWDREGTGQWDRTGEWDRLTDTGQWDQVGDTGQWDRYADGGGQGRYADGGSQGRYAEVDRWDRATPPTPLREGRAAEQAEALWSGTQLAGDDPRWMETPRSAPRSPVVAYTAPRPRPLRRAEPVGAGRGGTSTARRRTETTASGSWSRWLEDDLLDADRGGAIRPLVYTAACYLVPALLAFVGLLFLDGQPPAGCVTDISGGGCDSPQAHALASLIAGAPRFGLALASSLVVAMVLRRVGTTWRSGTVALAAAVVGGGLSTVLISAVTGQPIG